MVFLNTPDDCQWLRETHLPVPAPMFRSFTLDGHEDSPVRVCLYDSATPDVDDVPIAEYRGVGNGRMRGLMLAEVPDTQLTVTLDDVLVTAGGLCSEGDNLEYDRALVELIFELFPWASREDVELTLLGRQLDSAL